MNLWQHDHMLAYARFIALFTVLVFTALFAADTGTDPKPAADTDNRKAHPAEVKGALRLTPDPELVTWIRTKIQKPMRVHCGECHADGERDGGFRIDTYADIISGGHDYPVGIRPWQEDRSPVLQMMQWALDQDLNMPPKERAPADFVADVQKWIAMGAPWPANDP